MVRLGKLINMKLKLLSITFLCTVLCLLNLAANAGTSSSQIITASLRHYVSVSNVNNTSTSVSINSDGTLTGNLNSVFKFISNNINGASATFNVKVNTSDNGQVSAISGTSSTNAGKIILANTNVFPSNASIKNALSDMPVASNNPNVIAYKVLFKSENLNTGQAPVFNKSGDTVSGNILKKNGSNTITIFIDKNSLKQGTFSADDDIGNYQAIIYCTSATL